MSPYEDERKFILIIFEAAIERDHVE